MSIEGVVDVLTWRNWLSKNPVTVIYPLATPTTAATRIGLIEGAGPSPHTYIPVKRLSDGFYGLYCPEDGTFTDNLGGAYFGGHDDLFARKRLPEEYWEVEYLESTGRIHEDPANIAALRKSDLAYGLYVVATGEFTAVPDPSPYHYGAIVPYPQDISLGGKGVACIKGPRLPQEYQQVEYLESHGEEYLSMGSVESSDTALDIRVRFAPTRLVGIYNGGYDGVLGDNGLPQLGWYATGWTCGNAGSQLPYPPVVGTVYEYGYTGGGGKYYIDGQDTGLVRTGTVNTGLFRCESGTKPSRIYSAVVKSSTINYNMIPARRKSDNKPGMYDLVGKQFYTNQGTGEFTCGPDCGSYVDGRLIDYPAEQTIWAKPAVLTNASGEILRDVNGELLTTADDDII